METRPLLVLGLGIATGAALAQPIEALVRHILVAALLCVAVYLACVRTARPAAIITLCALALGIASGKMHLASTPGPPKPHIIRAWCTVLDVTEDSSTASSYTCETDNGTAYAVASSGHAPAPARRVLLAGRVDPFDGPRNPGEPDESQIQAERGLTARLSGARMYANVPARCANVHCLLALAHAWAQTQLQERMAEPYAAIAAGELWGSRGALPPELRSEFQETGTVHILVTAGLHLGVVALVVMGVLRWLTVARTYACAITAIAIWAYVIFSGSHLPSVRAALMITFGVAAYAAGAAPLSWNAFGLAMGVVALLWPQAVCGASFALSFSCVGAITLLADELTRFLEHLDLPKKVEEALLLTVATQLGTWPLTASIFLIIAPYAVVANLLVVPVVGVTMVLGALQLIFSFSNSAAQLFANANSWLLAWIVAAVHSTASLPHSRIIPKPPPDALRIAVYDAALVFAVMFQKKQMRAAACLALFAGAAAVLVPAAHPLSPLRITVLDVSQADGIVIQTPSGHVLLVDAGGRLERTAQGQSSAEAAGERIVVPFLIRSGIRHIDALILSHPHGDHVGGAAPILRDGFSVGEVADSGQQYSGYAWRDAITTARADRVPVVYPRAGAVWRTNDGVTLTFIGPSVPFIQSNNAINDNSIAFVLQYKHFRMLFTGDAGVAAEQRFLNEDIDLRADVLKVGHHGSAYSSTPAFIAAVHPKDAIISVGRHNLFGHPAASTIETLQRLGTRVYRTDENGAVMIVTDGFTETVSSMLK